MVDITAKLIYLHHEISGNVLQLHPFNNNSKPCHFACVNVNNDMFNPFFTGNTSQESRKKAIFID